MQEGEFIHKNSKTKLIRYMEENIYLLENKQKPFLVVRGIT